MLKFALPVLYAVGPNLVYKMIQDRMSDAIPLNKLLGIHIETIGDGVAEARVAFRHEVANHIGTAHATLVFGLAEAASGAAMSGALAPYMAQVRPVARQAEIKFLKVSKSAMTAKAAVSGHTKALRSELSETGKVVFDVHVSVTDAEGSNISEVIVNWHVTLR